MRRDAQENRERLLSAARSVYATAGHSAPLEAIARVAEVSRTTLHRHFETREQLTAALYEDNIGRIEAFAQELSGEPDAVLRLWDLILDLQLSTRAVAPVLSSRDDDAYVDLARRTTAVLRRSLADGRAAGVVRPETSLDDLLEAIQMVESTLGEPDPVRRAQRHRRSSDVLRRGLFALSDTGPQRG